MKDQQIEEAMAVLDGWNKPYSTDRQSEYWTDKLGIAYGSTTPPPYLTSHDAAERVVGAMSDDEIDGYGMHIMLICERDYTGDGEYFGPFDVRQTYQATPRQKCEGALKEKGIWETKAQSK